MFALFSCVVSRWQKSDALTENRCTYVYGLGKPTGFGVSLPRCKNIKHIKPVQDRP